MINFKQMGGFEILESKNDIYFKVKCFYHANTELYDRRLTDKMSPLDPTEAWIDGENRGLSSNNAIRTYRECQRLISGLTGIPFDRDIWNTCDTKYRQLSAQGWINLYNYLVDIGEMNFVKEGTVGELHIE